MLARFGTSSSLSESSFGGNLDSVKLSGGDGFVASQGVLRASEVSDEFEDKEDKLPVEVEGGSIVSEGSNVDLMKILRKCRGTI